ncbi:MAG: RsmB/NOP family class I SAM-dependent RNA methyltransferase [Methylobacillus glycogenes]|nr:RsmB/NOP family class I SAM-dependent RNA methyltransferase [Methylobacillus glycogenes]
MNQNLLRLAGVVLADVLSGSGPADAKLGSFFRQNRELGTKERAWIAESVYGVLRRKSFLAAMAGNEDPRRLLVAWLVKIQGGSLRELENMLNKQQTEWAQEIKAKSTDGLSPAEQADLPEWLWQRLEAQYGNEQALAIARSMHKPASLDLRVNLVKANRDEVMARFDTEKAGAELTPYSPTGIRMPQRMSISRHPLFMDGKIEVQDEGSQLLALLVAPRRGEMIADFCAGAGGKSLALGALMRNSGRLYAFDVSEKRLYNLGQRLKRSGLSNLYSQVISSENDPKLKRLNGKFNRVLVDAPCSGLGTLRRNPDLKWKQTPKDVEELTAKQASILARAAKLVKAGGRLIYATCSLLAEENEQLAEAFLAAHPQFQLVNAADVLAQQQVKLDTGAYLKLLPHQHETDGFFAAVFELKAATAAKAADQSAEIAASNVVVEEVAEPALVEAEVAEAEVAASKASKAKVAKPKVAKAKVSKPSAKTAKASESEVTDAEVAESAVSESKVTGTKASKVKASKTEVSEVESSEAEGSKAEGSQTEASKPAAKTTKPRASKSAATKATATKPKTTKPKVAKDPV